MVAKMGGEDGEMDGLAIYRRKNQYDIIVDH